MNGRKPNQLHQQSHLRYSFHAKSLKQWDGEDPSCALCQTPCNPEAYSHWLRNRFVPGDNHPKTTAERSSRWLRIKRKNPNGAASQRAVISRLLRSHNDESMGYTPRINHPGVGLPPQGCILINGWNTPWCWGAQLRMCPSDKATDATPKTPMKLLIENQFLKFTEIPFSS